MFMVIEGTDGSGKETQQKKLVERIKEETNRDVAEFDFPQYEETFFGKLVGNYLNGDFGELDQVDPHLAALLYAGDRWQASKSIRSALESGKIVISNRYVLSNAHQVSKVSRGDREEFWDYVFELEYETYGIPKEDLNVYLYVPPEIAQDLILKKSDRKYLNGALKDIAEKDLEHQKRTAEVYFNLSAKSPEKVRTIDCTKNGKLMSIEEIHELIWKEVEHEIN